MSNDETSAEDPDFRFEREFVVAPLEEMTGL
jgi:hypothetical protein